MQYTRKTVYIIFILFIYLTCCQRNNSQEKIVDETSNLAGIVEVSHKNDSILFKEIELIPLEEDEGLKLEVEYSKEENTPDTFIIYTTKGREFFRFQEKCYNQFNKDNEDIKHLEHEGDLSKGIFFPYLDFSSSDSYGIYHRERFCFVDGKNGKVKFFSVFSLAFEIDNSASYLCIGKGANPGVPTVTIYNIETGEELKKVVYEPYRDVAMFPIKINYEDGAFTVYISADTVEFTTLRIPIDGGDDYQVIDSFSFNDKRAQR